MAGPASWTADDWRAYEAHFNAGPGDRIIHYADHGKDTDGSSDHHHAIRGDIGELQAAVGKLQEAVDALRGGALPTLEGSALISLVVSPSAPAPAPAPAPQT